jgi:hypothetical protein
VDARQKAGHDELGQKAPFHWLHFELAVKDEAAAYKPAATVSGCFHIWL